MMPNNNQHNPYGQIWTAPELKLSREIPEWWGVLLKVHPQERTSFFYTRKPQQMPGLMFQLFWDIFKNA